MDEEEFKKQLEIEKAKIREEEAKVPVLDETKAVANFKDDSISKIYGDFHKGNNFQHLWSSVIPCNRILKGVFMDKEE